MTKNPTDNLVDWALTALNQPDLSDDDLNGIVQDTIKEAGPAAVPVLARVVTGQWRRFNS